MSRKSKRYRVVLLKWSPHLSRFVRVSASTYMSRQAAERHRNEVRDQCQCTPGRWTTRLELDRSAYWAARHAKRQATDPDYRQRRLIYAKLWQRAKRSPAASLPTPKGF